MELMDQPDDSWARAVEAFLAAALDSEHSRRAYARALEEARSSMALTRLSQLSVKALTDYRTSLLERDLAPASMNQRLAALRSFLGWAHALGLHDLPVDAVRAVLRLPRSDVRRPYQVLTEPEAAVLLRSPQSARDRAMLAILLGAGLRVSELVALEVADLIEDQGGEMMLHVRHGKGRKTRTVPVRADVATLVRRYVASSGRRLGDPGPLFLANDRGAARRGAQPITARSVGHLVSAATDAAGVVAKRVTPHALRHTYALRTLRHTGNVMAVAKLLGHAQLSTTQRYVDHLSLAELREAVPMLPVSVQNQPPIAGASQESRVSEREGSDLPNLTP